MVVKMKIKITGSFICADYKNLAKDIKELSGSGVDGLHFDIMDGVFVPNITIGPDIIKAVRPLTGLSFDTHLMIVNPEKYVKRFISAGSNLITIHCEACRRIPATLKLIKRLGAKAMISVNPETRIEKIYPYLSLVDGVLVMSVHPGFAGQKFMLEVLPKVRKLRQEKKFKKDIQIDGGINTGNISTVVKAGVNFIVIGNALLLNRPLKKTVRAFRKEIRG